MNGDAFTLEEQSDMLSAAWGGRLKLGKKKSSLGAPYFPTYLKAEVGVTKYRTQKTGFFSQDFSHLKPDPDFLSFTQGLRSDYA